MTIRVGLSIPQEHLRYRDLRLAWQRSEELGADTLWNWDHFFPLTANASGSHFEALSLLAAMAEVTERVEIGCLVLCNSYRNPNLVADCARTIDHIAGGRFVLGVGAGWYERDYVEYGYHFGSALERVRELERNVPIMLDRLAAVNPPPVRRIPLLLGGGGEKHMLRIVARHADIWNVAGDCRSVKRKARILDTWCETVGRAPEAIERSVGLWNTDWLSDVEEYLAAGVTHFIVGVGPPPLDWGPAQELLAWRNAITTT